MHPSSFYLLLHFLPVIDTRKESTTVWRLLWQLASFLAQKISKSSLDWFKQQFFFVFCFFNKAGLTRWLGTWVRTSCRGLIVKQFDHITSWQIYTSMVSCFITLIIISAFRLRSEQTLQTWTGPSNVSNMVKTRLVLLPDCLFYGQSIFFSCSCVCASLTPPSPHTQVLVMLVVSFNVLCDEVNRLSLALSRCNTEAS